MTKSRTSRATHEAAINLPNVAWLTLNQALIWLATGRSFDHDALSTTSAEGRSADSTGTGKQQGLTKAIDAAWNFLRNGAQAGQVVLEGFPWDVRRSVSMQRDILAGGISDKPERIDPRCFFGPLKHYGLPKLNEVRHDILGFGLSFRKPSVEWPYAATAWSDVHVNRDELIKYAVDRGWTPALASPRSSDATDTGGAMSSSSTAKRHRQIPPELEDSLVAAHNLLGHQARVLSKENLTINETADRLSKSPVNKSFGYSFETIRKMLAGRYGPFKKLSLGPLGK
jgi:hypothetical protein